ncbi:thioesterase family protein [Gallaecimonas sp. GXIMD4217]|uniref:acyl-CoA thioesterase n=1 Tax=Gallaecimonas sp. GXIMD4217 TaxID=3131927 RepID=UPI00311B2BE8
MWTLRLMPRFQETDALGHINNTVPAIWFEQAREPLFRLFTPDLDVKDWHLIVAGYNIQFQAELQYGREVAIRTGISHIGNSSFKIRQEAWQDGKCCVVGETAMVHFDHGLKKSKPLTAELKEQLSIHMVE